eukprot:765782-Hanusia_phi.AAC.2
MVNHDDEEFGLETEEKSTKLDVVLRLDNIGRIEVMFTSEMDVPVASATACLKLTRFPASKFCGGICMSTAYSRTFAETFLGCSGGLGDGAGVEVEVEGEAAGEPGEEEVEVEGGGEEGVEG